MPNVPQVKLDAPDNDKDFHRLQSRSKKYENVKHMRMKRLPAELLLLSTAPAAYRNLLFAQENIQCLMHLIGLFTLMTFSVVRTQSQKHIS